MFVKLCGLRTEADVTVAVEAGADAVGFVLTTSPRQIDVDLARRLVAAVPEHVLSVAVVRGITAAEAGELALRTGVQALQLHGDYPREAFDELAGQPFRLRVAPRWMLKLMGLFVPVLRENDEMMYQFEHDYRFDSGKIASAFGLRATPYREGIGETLKRAASGAAGQ